MRSDQDLQKDVQDAINWEPLLNIAQVGVTVIDAIVTLTGTVNSYFKKMKAEEAAANVTGIRAVLEKIEVRFDNDDNKTDGEIAMEVLHALKANWQVPYHKIKVKVEDGWVTLEGDVEWKYQADAVKKSVLNLDGVKVVTNHIVVQPETVDELVKGAIERALARNWSMDDQDITVDVLANNVTLYGTVNSYYQKNEAERIAWNAPGVWTVKNELVIDFKD